MTQEAFKKELWAAADKPRGSVVSAAYERPVLGLEIREQGEPRLPAARIQPQAKSEWLCRTATRNLFQPRPDSLVRCDGVTYIVDAKWKLLDADAADRNYGIAQGDLYQLFAYGQRYLGGHGQMVLMYPGTSSFRGPLDPFHFDDRLRLDVLPLDLDAGRWQGACLTTLGVIQGLIKLAEEITGARPPDGMRGVSPTTKSNAVEGWIEHRFRRAVAETLAWTPVEFVLDLPHPRGGQGDINHGAIADLVRQPIAITGRRRQRRSVAVPRRASHGCVDRR